MSDLRSEFRPIAFPRPLEAAGGSPSFSDRHVGTQDGQPAEPTPHPHSHSGFVVEDRCEPEDDFCDDAPASGSLENHSPIAGRIGASRIAPPSGEATPGDLVEMILRLGQRLRGHLDGRFGAFGLSDARFAALAVIREAAPAGCTQAHLAAKLGQCESSISTLVERMRASHLLYRLRAKSDRRKRVLMLTDEGRALLDQGLACRDREAQTMFSQMSGDEQRELAQVLGRLFATLDRLAVETPTRELERPAA